MPVMKGLRDWRTQMPDSDLERFEAAAGDLLEELGYERKIPRILPQAQNHAARIVDQFTAALYSVRKPLPEGWPFAG
jgi:hypothetical protein